MGIRRKSKNIKLSVEHYSSQLFINKIDICSNCPLKLYNKENDTIVFGTGNRVTNTMIILPSYDINADVNYNTILKIQIRALEEMNNVPDKLIVWSEK